jgi:hypothetical protein
MMKEAKIARHLNHRAITTYVGLFVDKREILDPSANVYLVSIYINGGTAKAYLAENRSLALSEKLVSNSNIR